MIRNLHNTVAACALLVAVNGGWAQEQELKPLPLPHKVYSDCDEDTGAFAPSGWMGDHEALEFNACCKKSPATGKHCIEITFNEPKGWAGVVWQNPANNWGEHEGGVNLSGAKQLTFWARGDKGGEIVEFKMGIVGKNATYYDTTRAGLPRLTLNKRWRRYTIPLTGKNLTRIVSGFVAVVEGKPDPVTIYLDEITYQ